MSLQHLLPVFYQVYHYWMAIMSLLHRYIRVTGIGYCWESWQGHMGEIVASLLHHIPRKSPICTLSQSTSRSTTTGWSLCCSCTNTLGSSALGITAKAGTGKWMKSCHLCPSCKFLPVQFGYFLSFHGSFSVSWIITFVQLISLSIMCWVAFVSIRGL